MTDGLYILTSYGLEPLETYLYENCSINEESHHELDLVECKFLGIKNYKARANFDEEAELITDFEYREID